MYLAGMAESTNIFDSSPPIFGIRDPIDMGVEYGQIFDALLVDLSLAETVYSRAVKKHFQSWLVAEDIPFERLTQCDKRGHFPVWVTQTSVSVLVPTDREEREQAKGALCSRLEGLLSSLVAQILSCWSPGLRLGLVDPLSSSIIKMQGSVYSFFLKQRWLVTDG
jgi:hypothetical protein